MTLVYDETGVPGAVADVVQDTGGKHRLAYYYDEPEEGAELVYTDNERIAADYEAEGVEVRPLDHTDVEAEAELDDFTHNHDTE